ncbi:histone acetyltransferase KAT6B-like isoform X2 [Trifolium pratense]|uniref:histone acetyltransferase KAT6B-like isoform X2 n=1 Tax=Trifolium pratense TaxID=57577 RepID=UPI001E695364|nr:histone acetyltransferase KAT6B-like isoform X2 [Trifolium pratense]
MHMRPHVSFSWRFNSDSLARLLFNENDHYCLCRISLFYFLYGLTFVKESVGNHEADSLQGVFTSHNTSNKLKQEMEEKRRQDKEATETKIQQEKEAIERKLQILLKAIVNQNTANLDVEALQALISAPTTDAPNDNEINNDDIEEEMQDHGEEEEEEEEEEELDVYV